MCKLDVISQERLKIEVKLLLSANGKSYEHVYYALVRRVDWHNSRSP